MTGRPVRRRPSRRELLVAILGAGGAAALGASVLFARSGGRASTRRRLDDLGEAPLEALAALGAAYLHVRPGIKEEALWKEVEARVGAWPAAGGEGAALRRGVVEAIERDFAEGSTVALDGWIVAETTARIGALAALGRE